MLNKNYSTRNFFYTENGNNNKSKYSLSTVSTCCDTRKLDQSFELDSYSNGKGRGNFDDNDLDKNINNLFLSMDYDKETQNEIQKINNYYSKKKNKFTNNFNQKIDPTIKDLCLSMDVDYQEYLDFKNSKEIDFFFKEAQLEEIKKMEDEYYDQYWLIIDKIDKERINTVNNYKKKRDNKKIYGFK